MRKLIALLTLLLPLHALAADAAPARTETATFAGGCFWCMVPPFKNLPGVISVTSGYTGGHVPNPSYEQVSSGDTGHAESVEIVYDPAKLDYPHLLDVYWHNIDPTTPARQFCDTGDQYRTAIFYHGETQKQQAVASRDALARSGVLKGAIVTQIVAAGPFYPAEQYHQDYYLKNELRYQIYHHGCGRDQRLKELYGDKAGGH
jgi:peptide-methionine (S)-S-oxide reductase